MARSLVHGSILPGVRGVVLPSPFELRGLRLFHLRRRGTLLMLRSVWLLICYAPNQNGTLAGRDGGEP